MNIRHWALRTDRLQQVLSLKAAYEQSMNLVKTHAALIDAREQETLLPFYEFMFDEHIRNIRKEIEVYKKSQAADLIKPVSDPINEISDPITERLYQAILKNNKLNYAEYGALLGVSEATIKRRLGELRKAGMIVRMGSNKSGYWEVASLEDRKERKV